MINEIITLLVNNNIKVICITIDDQNSGQSNININISNLIVTYYLFTLFFYSSVAKFCFEGRVKIHTKLSINYNSSI